MKRRKSLYTGHLRKVTERREYGKQKCEGESKGKRDSRGRKSYSIAPAMIKRKSDRKGKKACTT